MLMLVMQNLKLTPSVPKSLIYDGNNHWQQQSIKNCKSFLCWCLEGKASGFYLLQTLIIST